MINRLYHPSIINALLKCDGVGPTKTANIINGIYESKKKPYHKVLVGLGIPYLGETGAKSIENWIDDSEVELIKGIANALYDARRR